MAERGGKSGNIFVREAAVPLERSELQGPLPTLIDNREGNTMLAAIKRLTSESRLLDIATGYFEIGALVDLDGSWQQLEGIRILMGGDTGRQSRQAFVQSVIENEDENGIERAKEEDDWKALEGLQSVRAAIIAGAIDAKVFTRAKFHAKAFHFKTGGVSNRGIIGSSNFTHPGLTQNLELNLFTSDNAQLTELDRWYEQAWAEAEDVKPELLNVIEPHVVEYLPFQIYLRAMREKFGGADAEEERWEHSSELYKALATYQKDAYHDLLHMGKEWGGGLLCDGVGLGKTFVGLMLIEHALKKLRHRVLIIAPKAAIPSVWNRNLSRFFPDDFDPDPDYQHDIRVIPMTDFGRDGEITDERLAKLHERFETIIIDEAHHFRMPYRNRSKKLKQLTKDRRVFMLTATPINNTLLDLYNLINYIAQDRQRHFQPVGIANLRGWFSEKMDEKDYDQPPLDFSEDPAYEQFLKNVLVQRSRRYVKSLDQHDDPNVKFPVRERPEVISYSLKEVYGDLLLQLFDAFHPKKAKLKLVIYETEKFKEENQQDTQTLQEQSNVVGLVRTMLLKRMESSQKALEASVEDLLLKHAMLLQDVNQISYEAWKGFHPDVYEILEQHRKERYGRDDDEEEDFPLTPYETKKINAVRADINSFGINKETWIAGLVNDLDQLTDLLRGLYQVTKPENDDKLKAFIKKIKETPRLMNQKFVLFSEFKDTARYLETELKKHFPGEAIIEVDSGRNVKNRETIIQRFAPYYNCENDEELQKSLADPIRILVSTDVLSEGLNLQDANIIVNYDLHWNPVRLMQRIGRVDRRMDPSKPIDYDKVYVYNFLPPKELNEVLHLYEAISSKLIAINRSLGIEAPVLTAEDDFKAMDFYLNAGFGELTPAEQLRLKALDLERDHPELWQAAGKYPKRIYSGKAAEQPKYLFLCYKVVTGINKEDEENPEVYDTRWYLVDRETGTVIEDPATIHEMIACPETTPRIVELPTEERTKLRKKIEANEIGKVHLLGSVPATYQGRTVKDHLMCWMEVG